MARISFTALAGLSWVLVAATASRAMAADVKDISFIGFSHDDTTSAWRVVVHRTWPDGVSDHFTLIKIVDSRTDRLVESFRDSQLTHDKHGTATGGAVHKNLDWDAAHSRGAWLAWSRRTHYGAVKLDFKDNLVRLLPDDDAQLAMQGDIPHKALDVRGRPGDSLGFTAITRLFEGEIVPLGHFRVEGQAGVSRHAKVQVYHAPDGCSIAVLVRFDDGAADGSLGQGRVVTTPPFDPIGSTHIGTMPMIKAQRHSVMWRYEDLHPDAEHKHGIDVSKYF